MAVEVLLPKLGLTMETGSIEEFLVAAGSQVEIGDPLWRMSTDKVDADVEAEASGLFHPVVGIGIDLVPGTLVGWLLAEGEDVPAGPVMPATATSEPVVATEVAAAAPDRPMQADPSARSGRRLVSPNARRVAAERGVDVESLKGTGPNGRVIAADVLDARPPTTAPTVGSPLVRRAAAAAGVDLDTVSPTGPGGRVLRADVAAAARRPAQAPAAGAESSPVIIPLTGARGVIASRMHASLQEMAQLTLGTDATMDAAVALRAQLKQQWATDGLPVPTITDLIVRAAALALLDHPRLNASVRDNAIHVLSDINVGVAVALDDGLIVPVVKGADRLTLSGIAGETRRLAQAARSNKLSLPDLEMGTFTVSTLGSFGIDFFTPVITPGQVAILGVGRLRDSVRWDGETPVRTQVLTLSLTFDHRAVDGAPAAEYLRSVVSRLQSPLTLLS